LKIASANGRGELTLESLAPGLYKMYAFADPDEGLLKTPEFLDFFTGTTVRITNGDELDLNPRLIPRSEFDAAKERF
jgi:hypothetical protein